MGKIPGYTDGGYEDDSWDGGNDPVGKNPTGRPTRSSARTRRKKLRRLFRGTQWDPEKDK
jgi:hypothetical protein